MLNNEISNRYAKALYSLATESNKTETIFEEIRQIKNALNADDEIKEQLNSKTLSRDDRSKIIELTFKNLKISDEVQSFLKLLVKKDRLDIFVGVVDAYEKTIDEANGVTRGIVKSMSILSNDERIAVEAKVAKALNKKVIFTYETDESIVGGLVVEVGGYRFDDTLVSHLRRLKEELKRSSH
ncbi:MAG: ATP synthase F1 subunit delta [Bdellovibrionaceae bacterium]|jgi:F-type H+-transporting ATPase subunit delta|nr:ATP synthase F1 subunit delta [Pseudobdellovibrionaceae bacterium]